MDGLKSESSPGGSGGGNGGTAGGGGGAVGGSSPSQSPSSSPKLQPCPHYAKNKCFFGDNCKYAHIGPGNTAERPKSMTKCPFYSAGKCFYGDRCQYSHSGLPPPPSMAIPAAQVAGVMGAGSAAPLGGLPIVPIGGLREGLHGGAGGAGGGGRDVLPSYESLSLYYATYIYPYVQMLGMAYPGLHKNGRSPNRPHVHHPPPPPSHYRKPANTPSVKPCRFWAEGSCSYGDSCKFTHYGEAGSGIPEQWAHFKRSASDMDGEDENVPGIADGDDTGVGQDGDREKKRRKENTGKD